MEQAVNVNFRLDAAVKKNMEQVCAELGLSMSAAFTIFAKKVMSLWIRFMMSGICTISNKSWKHTERESCALPNMISLRIDDEKA